MPELSATQVRVAYRKAGANALNKIAVQARTAAVRAIREKYNVKYGAALNRIRIVKARPDKLEAYIVVDNEGKNVRIPKGKFSARQTSTGVTVRYASDWTEHIKHAFIPKLPSGHRGVFKRSGAKRLMKKGKYGPNYDTGERYLRQPIIELAGPKITSLYRRSRAEQAVKNAARKLYGLLYAELRHQIKQRI